MPDLFAAVPDRRFPIPDSRLPIGGQRTNGFQFIQDTVEYNTVTHHYNMDSYERLQPEGMRRNATLAAAFAFLAANRDDLLPRKPLPAPAAGRGGRGGQ